MIKLDKDISFELSSNGVKNFLVATFQKLNLVEYQMEMINNDSDNGLIAIEKRQFNESVQLCYNITSVITLENFFRNNVITKNQFLNILKELSLKLIEAEEYYLTNNNYVLDIDKIFIDEKNLKLMFIYIPVEELLISDVNEKFKKLIKDIIVDYAEIEDNGSDNFIQKILNYLKKDNITIKSFFDFFNNSIGYSAENGRPNNFSINTLVKEPVAVKQKNIIESSPEIRATHVAPPREVSNNRQPAVNKKAKEKASPKVANQESINEEYKMIFKPLNIILTILIQVLAVALSIVGFFIEGFDITQKLGLVLILAAIDFIIVRSLLDKKKKIKVRVKTKNPSVSKAKSDKKYMKNTEDIKSSPKVQVKPEISSNPSSMNLSKREISTEVAFETELLDLNKPYLLSNKAGVMEKIYISKDNFFLGRLSSEVDYTIANKAVGKVHAELRKSGNEYFITDLNSKNGTFINNQRLNSGTPYVLKENDQVTLADSVYVFKLY